MIRYRMALSEMMIHNTCSEAVELINSTNGDNQVWHLFSDLNFIF